MTHGKKFNLSVFFGKKNTQGAKGARARSLRLENLENRELLSASTLEDVALVEALTSTGAYVASASEIEPIDLSNAELEVVVTSFEDSGPGSLREAVSLVADGGRITFAGRGTVNLQYQIDVTKTITIDASSVRNSNGTPGVVISGQDNDFPAFVVLNGAGSADSPVTFDSLQISRGRSEQGTAFIFSPGTTSLVVNSAITNNNVAEGTVYVAGTATIKDTTISSNVGRRAGSALYVANGGVATLDHATVSSNSMTASNGGGAIYAASGGVANVVNSVVNNNTSENASQGGAAGYAVGNGTINYFSSTVANNQSGLYLAQNGNVNLYNTILVSNGASDVVSQGTARAYNSLSTYSNWSAGENNLVYDSSKPLFANGYYINEDSQVVDKGNNAYATSSQYAVIEKDFSGKDRIDHRTIDIGAYEATVTVETPSTVVTTLDDVIDDTDMVISLREALAYADADENLGTTISFASSLSGGTITLVDGEFVVTKGYTFDGTGVEAAITIDAGGSSRVFNISSDAGAVEVKNLTLTNGSADNGGAIYSLSDVTLTDVTISKTTAQRGGAVYVNGADLTITGSLITENNATTLGVLNVLDGDLTLAGSSIDNNVAKSAAALMVQSGQVTITDSVISNNAGQTVGAVEIMQSTLYAKNTIFENNTTTNTISEFLSGGAIVLFSNLNKLGLPYPSANATIEGCTFTGNQATGMNGGAISTNAGLTLTVNNSVFLNNSAANGGGAISVEGSTLNLNGVYFGGNSTEGNGGAVYTSAARIAVKDEDGRSTTETRSAVVNAINTVAVGNSAEKGGAFFFTGETSFSATNITVADNTTTGASAAIDAVGGEGNVYNSIVAFNTGANVRTTGVVNAYYTLSDSAAWSNSGDESASNYVYDPTCLLFAGEGDYSLASTSQAINLGNNEYLEGIDVDINGETRIVVNVVDLGAYEQQNPAIKETPSLVVDSLDDVCDEGDGVITLRDALRYAVLFPDLGDTITFADSLNEGGTITLADGALEVAGAFTIDATALEGDVVVDAGSLSRAFTVTVTEGAVEFKGLMITNGLASGEDVAGQGGAIYSLADLVLDGVAITNSSASLDGGAVYVAGANLVVTDSTISGNTANGGAALAVQNGSATITGGVFENNVGQASGAIALGSDGETAAEFTALIQGAVFDGNASQGNGGAISADHGFTVNVVGVKFTGNTATNGGAIGVEGAALNIVSSSLSGNEASDMGGAVFATGEGLLYYSTVSIGNSELVDNTADKGGAFFVDGASDYQLGNVTIAGNTTSALGSGALAASWEAAGSVYNSIIALNEGGAVYAMTVNGYNNLSTFVDWTNAEAEGVVNYDYNPDRELFANAEEGDYSITGHSQAVEIGDNAYVLDVYQGVDLGGVNARIIGDSVDIGAYEALDPEFPEAPGIVVTTLDDVVDIFDDVISLREAIEVYSVEGDVITFDATLAGGTIALDGATLTIDKALAIDASELEGGVTINGGDATRIFTITANAVLKNLAMTNGASTAQGGAIYANGAKLVLDSVSIANSAAKTMGGALYAMNGEVEITDSTFSENTGTIGSALYFMTTPSKLTNVTVSNNVGSTGAAVMAMQSEIEATNSVFENNVSSGTSDYFGGGALALFSNYGQLPYKPANATINGCSFINNEAAGKNGGAISTNAGLTLTITDSVFDGNKAKTSGGAISVLGSTLQVVNSSFRNNEAEGNGGAIYAAATSLAVRNPETNKNDTTTQQATVNVVNSEIVQNAAAQGGAVFFNNATEYEFKSVTVANNATTEEESGALAASSDANGEIYNTLVVLNNGSDVAADGIVAYNSMSSFQAWSNDDAVNYVFDPNQADFVFVDMANGDYALSNYSQAMERGDSAYVDWDYDLTGVNARIIGETVDIGAYEATDPQPQEEGGIVVTTLDDTINSYDGLISLREAVEIYSVSGDTITFDPSLNGQTITLSGKQISILKKDLSIDASALEDGITIDAAGESRAFIILGNYNPATGATNKYVTVSLTNLTVVNGDANVYRNETYNDVVLDNEEFKADGGAAFAYAVNLTLTNVAFNDNDAYKGGAVWHYSGTLAIKDSTFDGNTAGYEGGAVLAALLNGFTSENSTYTNNTATTYSSGAIRFDHLLGAGSITNDTITGNKSGKMGGAIHATKTTLTITGATVANNEAVLGGGLSTQTNSAVTILESEFTGNTASTGGGALYMGGGSSSLTLESVSIANNTASGSTYGGGGVYVRDASTFVASNTTFESNTATKFYGGAIAVGSNASATLTDVELTSNSALRGGALYNFGGTATIAEHSTVTGNNAQIGGAIFTTGGTTTVSYSTVSGNTASNQGGALYANGGTVKFVNSLAVENQAKMQGGAFYVQKGEVEAQSSTIACNSGGAGVYANTANSHVTLINTIAAQNGSVDVDYKNATVDGYNSLSTFEDWNDGENNIVYHWTEPLFVEDGYDLYVSDEGVSQAINFGDASLGEPLTVDFVGRDRVISGKMDIGAYEAEGEFTIEDPSIVVTTHKDIVNPFDGLISLREAVEVYSAAGNTITFDPSLNGKTITLRGDEITIKKNLKIDASALEDGVAVDAGDASRAFIVLGKFNANTGSTNGYANVTINNVAIMNGNATVYKNDSIGYPVLEQFKTNGGGIFAYAAKLTLNDVAVSGNKAQNGAGVWSYAGSLTINDSTFDGNTANYEGGAVYAALLNSFTSDSSTFSNNKATSYSSGAIRLSSIKGAASLTNVTISGNSSGKLGGAIYATNTKATITESTITGNKATLGGAIASQTKGAMTVANSEVSGNTSTTGGGAFYLGSGTCSLTLSDVLVANNTSSGSTYGGGGIYARDASTLTVSNSTFENNKAAKFYGGAISVGAGATASLADVEFTSNNALRGGAVCNFGAELTIDSASFAGNSAQIGGALYTTDGATTVSYSTLVGNSATNQGGALYANGDTVKIVDSLLVENTAKVKGSAIYVQGGEVETYNATIANNDGKAKVGVYANTANSTVSLYNSIVMNNTGAGIGLLGGTVNGYNTLSTFTDWTSGSDNLEYDPSKALFKDGGYELDAESQAIAAGNVDFVDVEFDLAGNPRTTDGKVDLGAYQYQATETSEALLDEAFAELFADDFEF